MICSYETFCCLLVLGARIRQAEKPKWKKMPGLAGSAKLIGSLLLLLKWQKLCQVELLPKPDFERLGDSLSVPSWFSP
jgi:hypothetical protein